MSLSFSSAARIVPLVFMLLLITVACETDEPAPEEPAEEAEIQFEKHGELDIVRGADTLLTVDIEIADTDSARERGLMGRERLPEMSGMLFVFPDEQPRSFWMADTPLALDLLFAQSDGEIVSISKYARPFSSASIESGDPARYVLEMPAGFADTHGIMEGDEIEWRRTE